MKKLLILAGAFLLIGLLSGVTYCQDEDLDYSYGSILEVDKTNNQITINEYDWEADKEVAVVYSVHPEAEFENTESLKDIPNGCYVDIEYVTEKEGKKVAKHITVYKPDEESDTE